VEPPRHEDDQKKPIGPFAGRAISLGLNMAVGVVVFTLAGHYVDITRGGGKGWTLGGVFLGLVYGAYEVWKVVRELEQEYAAKKGRSAAGTEKPSDG
jgi:hypothetical protein